MGLRKYRSACAGDTPVPAMPEYAARDEYAGVAVLSVPTLFVAFTINFIALALIWIYVARSYPSFLAARYWGAASTIAAVAASLSLLRGIIHPAVPILLGSAMFISAGLLAAMGIQKLYERRVMWREAIAVTVISVAALAVFAFWHESMTARILIYSAAQSIALASVLPLLFSRKDGEPRPGARMTGYISIFSIAIYWARPLAGFLQIGGEVSLIEFNSFQAVLLMLLVFSSMALNFGFVLMAVDRLRAEVADLALSDDLTAAANRRQLLIRLDEECARSNRTREPFALLMIDIDGFKAINDSLGHGVGDECLRLLTRNVQSQLRSGDLLARIGGDEFCVVLPSTTLREGAAMARHVLEACRTQWMPRSGTPVRFTASVGVAQWHGVPSSSPETLLAEADRALYAAKRAGKDRLALSEPQLPFEQSRKIA